MNTRDAVAGDKLILMELGKRKILVPQKGDKIEVKIPHGVVAEATYPSSEWRFKWPFFHRFDMVEEVTFFYHDRDGEPELWFISMSKRLFLSSFITGTKFSVTKYRRAFKNISDMFSDDMWVHADNPPGWDSPIDSFEN